jgi:5-methyltetrahydropteroyltriglutamate--homocysteine methyltransferase
MTATVAVRAPAFRVEQIGSLFRPPELIAAMERKLAGTIGDAELEDIQNKAIIYVIKMQEELGLPCLTDGEFRRFNYTRTFFTKTLGLSSFIRSSEEDLIIDRRITWTPTLVDDYKFLIAHTRRAAKVTLIGPCRGHWAASGRKHISKDVYPDMAQFWDDIVDAERKEIQSLADAGCTYVQMDDTTLAKFGDTRTQAKWAALGEPLEELLPTYISAINRCIANAPAGMAFGLHTCRGNSASHSLGFQRPSGGYDSVAERMFNELEFGTYFLEYDTPRAGDFTPLRLLPKGKVAVLGLISTKEPRVETADELVRRIEEASKYVDVSQLAISPQCGFSSGFKGHPLNVEQQTAKLRVAVEVAERVWGRA